MQVGVELAGAAQEVAQAHGGVALAELGRVGASSGVRAETLTDRFSRGMRPALSASSDGRSGSLR